MLLNRRGLSTMIVCRDCEHIFLCKNCQAPLACHDDECNLPNEFVCHSCGAREPMHLVCPKCSGTAIKYIGVGTQTVEREIKKLFPQVKILRIDKDVKTRELASDIQNADILVGTQFFIRNYLPQIKNIGLVGVVSADTLIYRPDFRSGEKIFSWLTGIINFTAERKSSAIIQTFFPSDFSISSAVNEKPELFYSEELENRQTLRYPPFGRLAKLAYACPSEKNCVDEEVRIFKILGN